MMSRTFAAGYIRIGVKEFLTMFEQHIAEIEKPDFQIQFVALGGYSVLELVLSTDANVKNLLADAATGQVGIHEVYERITHLLEVVETESELSYDGSIVVYLFCLIKLDPDLGYTASMEILDTKGLFWSRQLSRAFAKTYQERKITDSIVFTFDNREFAVFALTGREYTSLQDVDQDFYSLDMSKVSIENILQYAYEKPSRDQAEGGYVAQALTGSQVVFEDVSKPLQEFPVSVAS